MKKAILFIVGFLVVTFLLVFVFSFVNQGDEESVTDFESCVAAGNPVMESYPRQCRSGDKLFVEEIGNELEKSDLIRVSTPRPNEVIESPLFILGEAVGPWFFEASFPVRLEDEEGNVLAQVPAQAEGEWMTEEFVPFSAELIFEIPDTPTGKLILEKDNPSGLSENADMLWMPVRFGSLSENGQSEINIKTFFINDDLAPGSTDCSQVFSVERTIPQTKAVARAALEELLKGPTMEEKRANYATSINAGTKLQSIVIEDGVAKADFSEELDRGVAGSCRVTAIRSQIENTLLQFPTVNSVQISINGESETVLQP